MLPVLKEDLSPHKAEEPFLRLSPLFAVGPPVDRRSVVSSSYGCLDSVLIMFPVSAAERCTSSQQSPVYFLMFFL